MQKRASAATSRSVGCMVLGCGGPNGKDHEV